MADLSFQREVFSEIFAEDGLLVMAKGIGLQYILVKFLKLYCNPQSLVFVLNAMNNRHILNDALRLEGVPEKNLPKVISNEITSAERQKLYMEGGCFLVTSRILVVDLLSDKVDCKLISGFLINDAHKITETSAETFIMRIFRQKNVAGFIKAFSEEAQSLVSGFNKVEKVLRNLQVRRVFLFPRFHGSVASCFDEHQPNVIELAQPLTPHMHEMQQAILVAMDACLGELKKTRHLDTVDLTVENGLFKSFDLQVRRQLDPIWHKISPKTKQLVQDLKTLRKLLSYLVRYDAITFYSFLTMLKAANGQQRSPSLWLFTEAADRLYRLAKERLYIVKRATLPPPPPSLSATGATEHPNSKPIVVSGTNSDFHKDIKIELSSSSLSLTLEENPKWDLLSDILQEITTDYGANEEGHYMFAGGCRILVMVRDDRTAGQLKEYLQLGGQQMMQRRFRRFLFQQNSRAKKTLYPHHQPRQSAPHGQAKGEPGEKKFSMQVPPAESSLTVEQRMLLELESVLKDRETRQYGVALGVLSEDAVPKSVNNGPKRQRTSGPTPSESKVATRPNTSEKATADVSLPRVNEEQTSTGQTSDLKELLDEEETIEREANEDDEEIKMVLEDTEVQYMEEDEEVGPGSDFEESEELPKAEGKKKRVSPESSATFAMPSTASSSKQKKGGSCGGQSKQGGNKQKGRKRKTAPGLQDKTEAMEDLLDEDHFLSQVASYGISAAELEMIALLESEHKAASNVSKAGESIIKVEIAGGDVQQSRSAGLGQDEAEFVLEEMDPFHTVISTYQQVEEGENILQDLMPTYVVLYDPDVSFVRELEVYQARHTEITLKVYFLVYEESVEEQKYLTEIRREKEAFESLIQLKKHMMLPALPPPLPLSQLMARPQPPPLSMDTRTNRPATKKALTQRSTIVVDVREFRSALPSLLHGADVHLIPVTLEVGDFVLSPHICVERKSISDLFGSFASGRLYNQAENMKRHYRHPCLLIEFTPEKAFSLQLNTDISAEIQPSSITSKLVLLTTHFPQLRILWSRSPHFSVELFKMLKQNQDEPDPDVAMSAGTETSATGATSSSGLINYNHAVLDVLKKFPGITNDNSRALMHKIDCLADLCNMTFEDLRPIMGKANAWKLLQFLNMEAS